MSWAIKWYKKKFLLQIHLKLNIYSDVYKQEHDDDMISMKKNDSDESVLKYFGYGNNFSFSSDETYLLE